MQNKCAEIKIRSERRAGELIRRTRERGLKWLYIALRDGKKKIFGRNR